MIKSAFKHVAKLVLRPGYRRRCSILNSLQKVPRYTHATTDLLGPELTLVDAPSIVPMYEEIFEHEIYRFRSCSENPLIIDCGANVGLSVLYFKRLYPLCRIIAFEPDVQIFRALKHNVESFGVTDVEAVNKAVWVEDGKINFYVEGSDAGSLINSTSATGNVLVDAVRLKSFLSKSVELLKMDIEGAETEVLQDCREELANVQNIFVEYHSFPDQPQALPLLLNILDGSGFRIHIQTPAVVSPQPLNQRHTHNGMDMLLNVFGYRE